MKKQLLLALLMMMPLLVSADSVGIDGIYYNLNKKNYTADVTCDPSGIKYSGEVIIPEIITYEGTEYSVTSIGDWAFRVCSGLTSVTIPNSVSYIGICAFTDCSSLTSVTIPNGVTDIGYEAFSGCSGLASIAIPNSVTSIGGSAFSGCSGLTSIKVKSNNSVYDSRNNCNAIIETGTNTLIAGCKNTIIPNSVTEIGYCAFKECSGLTSITIPDNVTSIGYAAFFGCKKLTSITIPSSVTSIDDSAFKNCTGLTSMIIPSNVTIIDDDVFSGCKGLTSVTIPNGVSSIGESAFSGCKGLTSVTIPNGVSSIGEGAFSGCSGLTSISIPNGVTLIGELAFENCSSLTTIAIPHSVTTISYGAFRGCSKLKSVTIPNCVTYIDKDAFIGTAWYANQSDGLKYAGKVAYLYKGEMPVNTNIALKDGTLRIENRTFEYCGELTSITISNSVTSIGDRTFYQCSGLISVTVSNNVTFIGEGAFESCTGLTSITIPNNVTTLDWSAFAGCSSLTSVTIPNSVTSIGDRAFFQCSGLTSVTIPNSVTTIGWSAFCGCNGLTSIIIGSGVTNIGFNAFSKCTELTDVYCYAVSVPDTESNAFEGSCLENITLHVPKGCVDAYNAKKPWKSFKKIVEIIPKVKLSKSKAIIEKGKTLTLKATVSPSALPDKSVTWKSSNTKVATVTSEGKVKGVKAGTATITCTFNATGLKTTCKVTVGYVKLDQTEAIIQKGKTKTLKATVYPSALEDRSVTWKSSNTKVATVTSKGKVKGVKAGTATITCISNATGLKTTCKVTVGYVKLDQTEVTVKKGKTVTLTPTVYPSKLEDKTVTWTSSDKTIATVTSAGKVKGIKAGTATITCTSNATGLSTTCTVTVKATSGSRSLDGDDDETTGIEENVVAVEPFDVYDLSGHKVLNQVTSLDGLPKGIYIVNGRKVLKKN